MRHGLVDWIGPPLLDAALIVAVLGAWHVIRHRDDPDVWTTAILLVTYVAALIVTLVWPKNGPECCVAAFGVVTGVFVSAATLANENLVRRRHEHHRRTVRAGQRAEAPVELERDLAWEYRKFCYERSAGLATALIGVFTAASLNEAWSARILGATLCAGVGVVLLRGLADRRVDGFVPGQKGDRAKANALPRRWMLVVAVTFLILSPVSLVVLPPAGQG